MEAESDKTKQNTILNYFSKIPKEADKPCTAISKEMSDSTIEEDKKSLNVSNKRLRKSPPHSDEIPIFPVSPCGASTSQTQSPAPPDTWQEANLTNFDTSQTKLTSSWKNHEEHNTVASGSPNASSPNVKPFTPRPNLDTMKRTPDCLGQFPELKSTQDHMVLFEERKPENSSICDRWDTAHVKMPCSPRNLHNQSTSLWDVISYTLTYAKINSSLELEERILTYAMNFEDTNSFQSLHYFFRRCTDEYRESFFNTTLPKIIDYALMLPSLITKPLPLLRRGRSYKITMTHLQSASLMCNAFLCTFPNSIPDLTSINFASLFGLKKSEPNRQKLMCFFHYFDRLAENGASEGNITFERRCRSKQDLPTWEGNTSKFPNTFAVDHLGKIEQDGKGMLQVDFANKHIGGGTLHYGLVQEEIRFAICPELVISMLLCPTMEANEAVVITGAEQFSKYSGYSSTFKWAGPYHDATPLDPWKRLCTQVVAIDALRFSSAGVKKQFQMQQITRELTKACCGFDGAGEKSDNLPAIATGNWGCGVFRGDSILKALIQLMVAACYKRQLCYFTWKDVDLKHKLDHLYKLIRSTHIDVGGIWSLLKEYSNSDLQQDFYSFMVDSLMEQLE